MTVARCAVNTRALSNRSGRGRPYDRITSRNQTNKEIAQATGYCPSQISRILCSPDFLRLYDAAFLKVAHGARTKWQDSLKDVPEPPLFFSFVRIRDL